MSAIFGIFNRDGKPVIPEQLEQMESGLHFINYEKKDSKIINNIGFGYLLTYNTPESINEEMIRFLPEKNLLFMAKGRIDNREDLFSVLNILSNEKNSISDSELILRTYLKFEESSVNYLLGDWLFITFNTEKEELLIIQDHHGYTALDFYINDKCIIFSTNISALLKSDLLPKKINMEILTRFMAIWQGGFEKSLYENIEHLNPAHKLFVSKDTYNKKRYWFPEKIEENHKKPINEIIEDFSNILYESVKCRLRSYKPISSMLSGGLDSGTVSYIAGELLFNQGKTLTTFSHIPLFEPTQILNKASFGDERPYIESTVKASGNIIPVYLDSKEITPLNGIMKFMNVTKFPIHASVNSYWLYDLPNTSYKNGFGALLTGEHGNATISLQGVNYLLPFIFTLKSMGIKQALIKKLIRPIIFKYFKNIFLKIKYPTIGLKTYSYLNHKYIEDNRIQEKMNAEKFDLRFHENFSSKNELSLKILFPGENPRCYLGALTGDYFNLEYRDPTADKRVIEYILSIPNEMFFDSNANNKNFIKLLMKNKLSDKVLYSKTKGRQSADIGLRLRSDIDSIDNLLNEFKKNEFINYFIDMNRLNNVWEKFKSINNNEYDIIEMNNICRTVAACYFIQNYEKL